MNPAEPTPEELAGEPAESVVRTYLERWDAHDVEGMSRILGAGQVLTWEECEWGLYRETLLRRLAWRFGADFSISSYELEVEVTDTVQVTLKSATRVDELLSVQPPARSLSRPGIIRHTLVWVSSLPT